MWAVSKYEFSLLRRLSIVTLLAFAAERHAFVIDQYLLHTGRTAANPSAAVAVVDGWKRKTDRRTLKPFIDPAPHTRTASIKRHCPKRDPEG